MANNCKIMLMYKMATKIQRKKYHYKCDLIGMCHCASKKYRAEYCLYNSENNSMFLNDIYDSMYRVKNNGPSSEPCGTIFIEFRIKCVL